MNCNVGDYLNSLIVDAGISQADVAREIVVPRQLLTYVIRGTREMSLSLALRLESFFSLKEGELVKMQALQSLQMRKQLLRNRLCIKLLAKNAFWSYDVKSHDSIPDEEIIEKTFMILDMDDIELLFELYSRKFIYKVWKERMAIQGEYMLQLNIMIAIYYFGIKEPEKFLQRIEKQHINHIIKTSSNASGING